MKGTTSPVCEAWQSTAAPLTFRLTATRLNSSVSWLQFRVRLFLFFRSNMVTKRPQLQLQPAASPQESNSSRKERGRAKCHRPPGLWSSLSHVLNHRPLISIRLFERHRPSFKSPRAPEQAHWGKLTNQPAVHMSPLWTWVATNIVIIVYVVYVIFLWWSVWKCLF